MGFDQTGQYLLAVSQSGHGVYSLQTWERIARDTQLAYPENGLIEGIGPLSERQLSVKELDYDTGTLLVTTPDEGFELRYSEGTVAIVPIHS